MERAIFRTILELREEKHEASRNVATSQRRNVVIFASPLLKAKRGPKIEALGYVGKRALKESDSELDQ